MPHVCGDEPAARGRRRTARAVCPTYVGMNPRSGGGHNPHPRMPHVCGDEPQFASFSAASEAYAPRMWG